MDQQEALRKAAKGRDPNEVVTYGSRQPYVDGPTVASVQTAFARSRLSHQSWKSRLMDGRLDSRHAFRNDARGSVDIFKDRQAPSSTKLDVWLLVDASGSMAGEKACRAQDVAGTLVEAFKRIPTVNLHVWQHHAAAGKVQLIRVYQQGVPPRLERMNVNVAGGNADGFALQAIAGRAVRDVRRDTKVLVIVVSDGLPSVHGLGATNRDIQAHSATVAEDMRRKGMAVMAVAIEGETDAHARMYGEENVIPFEIGSPTRWADFSRTLATVFGRTLKQRAS
jgi:nitric oxide reductase activation protein